MPRTRTTPTRPLDIERIFPELAAYRRTTTRLHPRPGNPGPRDSSIGGPLLWPRDEPWPMCTEPHDRAHGHRMADVHRERRILAEAWTRTPAPGETAGPTDEERELLQSLCEGRHAPWLADTDPIPMLALAQLHRRDIPGLPAGPADTDLLQILWCPFDAHGSGYEMALHLRWRRSEEVTEILADQPEPPVVGFRGYVAEPCVLHPEQVVEHEYVELLPEDLQERIEEWEERLAEQAESESGEGAEPLDYDSDFSVAPGWKVGGYTHWNVTGPAHLVCACGQEMAPLLTIDSGERKGRDCSWVPMEERAAGWTHGCSTPTEVVVGRWSTMCVFACPADPAHPHQHCVQ